MKCADLPDNVVLDAITRTKRPLGATIEEVFEALPQYPQKMVRAKLSKLIRRGIIDGCTCGCRGDFSVRQVEAVRDRLDGGGLTERNITKAAQRVTDTINDALFLHGLRCTGADTEGAAMKLDDRQHVSIMKAAAMVGVSRRTIYNWIAAGKVEWMRTAGGSIRIFVDTLWRDGEKPERDDAQKKP